jgi:L-lysine 2,3-aminomutase
MQIIATSDTNTKPYVGHRLWQLIADRTGSQTLAQEVRVISQLLPFKINQFAADHLIDWKNAPKDPMYRLLVPHRDMLSKEDFFDIEQALDNKVQLNATVSRLRAKLNPHPGNQLNLNVPANQTGLQHKYQETVLVFPKQSQTCHSYCSYCFRWAQFVGDKTLKMAVDSPESMVSYLKQHPKVTDVLFTGGDPLVMKTEKLQAYIEPLLLPEFDHIKNIRIGTKAVAFNPYRITYGYEADTLLRLSEKIIAKRKHLAYMLHYSHPRELEHSLSKVAIKRLLMTGAQLRSQAPILHHINDSAQIWADMWKT